LLERGGRLLLLLLARETGNQFLEWSQFLLVDQVEFLDKEDEMLEAGIQMRFLAQTDNLGKVRVVDVGVDSK
jgi:hypothetical protein